AVTSHNRSVLNDAVFDSAVVTELLPPWTERFVGYAAPDSERAYSNSTRGLSMIVPGSGSDVWGASGAFHFVAEPMPGDTEIEARVITETNTGPFAKAGVMMRSNVGGDIGGGDATVILDVKPDGGIEFMVRSEPGSEMQYLAGGFQAMPVRLKII